LKAGENHALGIIETAGRAPLVEAVDNAIKAAAVTLKSSYFVGGGVNTVTLVGDVGAMRAALDAAKATFARMGVAGQTHLIPRLADDVWPLVMDQTNGRDPPPRQRPPESAKSGTAAKRDAAPPDKPPVPAEAGLPVEPALPSVPVPVEGHDAPESPVVAEPPALVPPPGEKEAHDKKAGEAQPGAPGKTLFPDAVSRPGQKGSGKSPRRKNPKPKG
jgi:energy-coupling factor transport system substrate-specific component